MALAIVATRASSHPEFPLQALTDELIPVRERLGSLATGESASTNLHTVFSWSIHQLPAHVRASFCLLGLHPGPDIGLGASSALAGLSLVATRDVLDHLVRTHLIEEVTPGRYIMHDLLKEYAAALANAPGNEGERHAAIIRVLNYYLQASFVARCQISPPQDPDSMCPVGEAVWIPRMESPNEALLWCNTEYADVVALANDEWWIDHYDQVWRLIWIWSQIFRNRASWQETLAIYQRALIAADDRGDLKAKAQIHLDLGWSLTCLGKGLEGITNYRTAHEFYGQLGDATGQANALDHIGQGHEREGRLEDAVDWYTKSLTTYTQLNNGPGQARVLNNMSWLYSCMRHFDKGVQYAHQALEDPNALHGHNRAYAFDSLGYALAGLKQHDEAVVAYQAALEIFREFGHRYGEATSLRNIAMMFLQCENRERARPYLLDALSILTDLDAVEAGEVRLLLDRAG